jgi:hypothetical protein
MLLKVIHSLQNIPCAITTTEQFHFECSVCTSRFQPTCHSVPIFASLSEIFEAGYLMKETGIKQNDREWLLLLNPRIAAVSFASFLLFWTVLLQNCLRQLLKKICSNILINLEYKFPELYLRLYFVHRHKSFRPLNN